MEMRQRRSCEISVKADKSVEHLRHERGTQLDVFSALPSQEMGGPSVFGPDGSQYIYAVDEVQCAG